MDDNNSGKTYEQGLVEGRLAHLEETQENHTTKLDENELRWRANDRIIYGILGAIFFIQVLPVLREVIK